MVGFFLFLNVSTEAVFASSDGVCNGVFLDYPDYSKRFHFQHIRKCCREHGPCDIGEGHCRSDDECSDGLKCGIENCDNDFPSELSDEPRLWQTWDSCCYCK